MTGAMSAAISGLKMHMDKLNVIGNNVANVNTPGYKSQRMLFQDSLYTTLQGGSNGTASTGGRNPSQLGYGVQLKSISLDMSVGSYNPTGKPTDMMIYGDGFFLVGDKNVANIINAQDSTPAALASLNLTRVGDFEFKADGYLTDGQGNAVYGFLATGVDDRGNAIISDQLVPIRIPRQFTTVTPGAGNDPAIATTQIFFPTVSDSGVLQDVTVTDDGDATVVAKYDSLSIDATGKITAYATDAGERITIGYLAIGNVTNPNGVTHTSGNYYTAGDGAGSLNISMFGGVGADLGITHVNGLDDNEGMRIGNTSAELLTSGLEGSKTDLATEISEMITAQRGYQANTRIITVTDSMLEELVNIKR